MWCACARSVGGAMARATAPHPDHPYGVCGTLASAHVPITIQTLFQKKIHENLVERDAALESWPPTAWQRAWTKRPVPANHPPSVCPWPAVPYSKFYLSRIFYSAHARCRTTRDARSSLSLWSGTRPRPAAAPGPETRHAGPAARPLRPLRSLMSKSACGEVVESLCSSSHF